MSQSWETPQPPRRRRWAAVVGAVAALVVGGWLARSGLDTGGDSALTVEHGATGEDDPAASPEAPDLPAWTELGQTRGDWTRLEDAPISVPGEHLGVWTGEELVIGFQPEVAAYDPAAGRWRQLPTVPGPLRVDPQVVWTGEHVLVFGGMTAGDAGGYQADGLLLDIDGGQWRAMPAAPAAPLWDATVVWTGEEVIVWGGARPGDAHELGAWPVRGSAYDPKEDRWRVLAEAPVEGVYHSDGVWTGREMVVWGDHHPPGEQLHDEAGPPFAAAYDPAGDRWRRLASPPLENPAEAAAIWTGRDVVLWGQHPDRPAGDRRWPPTIGTSLDPRAAEEGWEGWRLLPPVDTVGDPPTSIYGQAAALTGVGAVFYGGYPRSVGLVYDPVTQSVRRLPSRRADGNAVAAGAGRIHAVATWTGAELLLWGGYTTTGPGVDLWAFRPFGVQNPACRQGGAPPDASLPAGWSLATSPLFGPAPAVAAWTGADIIMMTAGPHGVIVDPVTGRRRCMPPSPLKGADAGVWTPAGLFVWGGDPPRADGALYDPIALTWRILPRVPLVARQPVAVIWTGEEVLVWGDAERGSARADGAAYDPATDMWRELPDAPAALNQADAVWTGEELIVYGAALDSSNAADTAHAVGLAYSPLTDRWRRLPDHPLSPQASTVAWTGDLLLAWDYGLQAAAYDPATDIWTPLPRPPFQAVECNPAGASVDGRVLAYCGQAALFDPATRAWTKIDAPTGLTSDPLASLGDAVVFADGRGLWRYHPNGERSRRPGIS